jgi:GxxExxY protein
MPATGAGTAISAHEISYEIIKAGLKVHSALGPGLLENAYKVCLAHELRKAGFTVGVEVELPVIYDSARMELGYRLDLLVNDLVVVELKAVDELTPLHQAQLLSYLKLSQKKLGLLMNFNVLHLKNGIKRMVEGTGWDKP